MAKRLLLALLATAAIGAALARSHDSCYAHQRPDERYLMFASKTAYEIVRYKTGAGRPEDIPHCEPVQLWLMNRHGTRFPGKITIQKMDAILADLRDSVIRNHAEGDGRLCDADLDALKEWRLNVSVEQANDLTWQGEQDLLLLGRRLRDRFPALLKLNYTTTRYEFRHTNEQRTKKSAEKFAEGLFGDPEWKAVYIPEALRNDTLLKPYDICETWLKSEANDPPEYNALLAGVEVAALVGNVSARLGFRASLKYDDVEVIYNACRFDKSWDIDHTSPWCAAFSKDELKLLEYVEDLMYYYKSGYGGTENIRLGCPLVKDLFTRFDALSQSGRDRGRSGEQPAAVFYFAHSSGLHMLQSALGAFKPTQPLRADNFRQQRDRAWQISRMGSFAANVAAIFYRCDRNEREREMVYFLSAEGPLHDLPPEMGCSVGLCPWSRVRDLLQPVADTCSLQWCDGKGAAPLRAPPLAALSLAAVAACVSAFAARYQGGAV